MQAPSRHGRLRRAGAPEGIAATAEDYAALVARFAAEARDPARREVRRAALRDASAVLDAEDPAVLRGLEAALLKVLAARR